MHKGKAGGAGIALKPEFARSEVVLLAGLALMQVSMDAELIPRRRLCGMAYALVLSGLPFLTGNHEH